MFQQHDRWFVFFFLNEKSETESKLKMSLSQDTIRFEKLRAKAKVVLGFVIELQ